MNEKWLSDILVSVQQGEYSVEDALTKLKDYPTENIEFAKLDHHRELRTGQPEVIFCQGKTSAQIVAIIERLGTQTSNVLATRLDPEKAEVVLTHFPAGYYDPLARCFLIHPLQDPVYEGKILVITAGTADLPVAQEAVITARYLGFEVSSLFDVGVAGLHRILDTREQLKEADVIIVVAGMEGALASVVGGLVEQPVVAVPTSIGYGANFQGLAALLSMLNSCASGIGVVNIDNGFGAASLAAAILRRLNLYYRKGK